MKCKFAPKTLRSYIPQTRGFLSWMATAFQAVRRQKMRQESPTPFSLTGIAIGEGKFTPLLFGKSFKKKDRF